MNKKIQEKVLKEVIKEQKQRDAYDLKNKLHPLYDIEQSVADSTLKDLLELHEAIAMVCGKKAISQTIELMEDENNRKVDDLIGISIELRKQKADFLKMIEETWESWKVIVDFKKELLAKLGDNLK